MINYIDQIYYRVFPSDQKNILCMPYNGFFEWMLYEIFKEDCRFFHQRDLMHRWDCNHWPDKFELFDFTAPDHNIPFDFFLVNNRNEQALSVGKICDYYHIPLAIIDHELPTTSSKKKLREYINKCSPNHCLMISPHELSFKEWEEYSCLNGDFKKAEYCFSTKETKDKENDIMSFGNFSEYDIDIINSIKKVDQSSSVYGFVDGCVSYESIETITNSMSSSRIYVGATRECSPPLDSMMAASYGCTVVLNKTRYSEYIFTDQENAVLYSDPKHLLEILKELKEDKEKTNKIGSNSRDLIHEKYNLKDHKNNWHLIFEDLSHRTYIK